MPTIWGIRDGLALRPYKMFQEKLGDIPEGARLRIKVEIDRSGKFNSFYHVMLSKVVDAVNSGPARTNIDTLKNWIKIECGWYETVKLDKPAPDGSTHAIEYKSTSFAKMDEDEFHQFARDTCDLIARKLAPWIEQSPEWQEIQQMIASISPEAAA